MLLLLVTGHARGDLGALPHLGHDAPLCHERNLSVYPIYIEIYLHLYLLKLLRSSVFRTVFLARAEASCFTASELSSAEENTHLGE